MKKKKNSRFRHMLKNQYKDSVKKQIERDFFLLSKSDIDHDSLFAPPLTKADTLFVKREIDNTIPNHLVGDDVIMQNGYASASIMMLNLIKISGNNFVKNSYINPIMFCFRQYLELSMKDSILRFRQWRKNANRGEANLEKHNLLLLWNNLKMYFNAHDAEIDCMEKIIKELNDVDEGGTLFRYNAFLSKNICNEEKQRPLIDADILYTRILQMYRFFEGVNELARNGLKK